MRIRVSRALLVDRRQRALAIPCLAKLTFAVLHDQLLAAQQHLSHPQAARPPQPPPAQPPHMQPNTSPRNQNNIDPAISGASMLAGPPQTPPQQDPSGPESPKTYGKRPLSTSKRAAQNRAAQVCDI